MKKLKAAWLSRHKPTPAQLKNLSEYEIVQVNPPGRFWSPVDALMESHRRCGGKPDLFVVVMPLAMLRNFVPLAGEVPVVQARMHKLDGEWCWTGEWLRVCGVHKVTEDWKPIGVQP